MIVPLILVAVLANVGLIRDTVSARLPDAVVPAAMLLGWLIKAAVEVRPPLRRGLACAAATIVVAVTMITATVVGATREQLEKAEMDGGLGRLLNHAQARTMQFHERFPRAQMPSRAASTLMPFFEYADRCLDLRDHILIPAYLPEAFVWARRPFAGGQVWFQQELLRSDDDHRLVMTRLGEQRVPVAILLTPSSAGVAERFPDLNAYLSTHFTSRTELKLDDGRVITLAFNPALAVGRDYLTGWYCFR
jgi:hypothetical protein